MASESLIHIGAQALASLPLADLVSALKDAFRGDTRVPLRHHHAVSGDHAPAGTLLLMPAWSDQALGVKIVSVFPENRARDLPSVYGTYLLLDRATGALRAVIEGTELTRRRTAAASALAASYLARPESARVLMVGTGALGSHLPLAYAAVRPVAEVLVWGRNNEKARVLAATLAEKGLPSRAVTNLGAAVEQADIVSCATLAREPLIRGEWLMPGTHLDLVGGFRPDMREADDEAIRRATVFVDTRAGAMKEAGDIVQPLANGALRPEQIAGDLFDLVRETVPGRSSPGQVTLFKSVGSAIEDLAVAQLAYGRLAKIG